MADNVYQVVVMRREQPGQLVLNYTDEERAIGVYDEITAGQQRAVVGGSIGVICFADDFSSRFSFDVRDIGNVFFQDVKKGAEMQTKVALINHEAQTRANAVASGGLVAARPALIGERH
jgi:hypothetical protein